MTRQRGSSGGSRGRPSAAAPLSGQAALGWQDRAACADADPDLFFSIGDAEVAEAKRICRGCEVLDRCRQWSLAVVNNGSDFGVAGGMTVEERRYRRRKGNR